LTGDAHAFEVSYGIAQENRGGISGLLFECAKIAQARELVDGGVLEEIG